MEKIDAVVLGPKWQPAYTTCIASNKEQAINKAETDSADVKVFTDGSCRDGDVVGCIHASYPQYKSNIF